MLPTRSAFGPPPLALPRAPAPAVDAQHPFVAHEALRPGPRARGQGRCRAHEAERELAEPRAGGDRAQGRRRACRVPSAHAAGRGRNASAGAGALRSLLGGGLGRPPFPFACKWLSPYNILKYKSTTPILIGAKTWADGPTFSKTDLKNSVQQKKS